MRYRTAHAMPRRYGRSMRDAGRSNAYQPARYYLYDGSLPARRAPGDAMTDKGVKSSDLHDLCIGGLLVCLTLLVGGRTVMLPDRGRDLPAAMATQGDRTRMDVPFFATRNTEVQAPTPAPADDTAIADFSIYLELHETRDFSVRTVPPSAHECRS